MTRRAVRTARNLRRRFVPRMEALEARRVFNLDPLLQPRFVNSLTVPAIMEPTEPGGTHYEVVVTQFQQELGLFHPKTGKPFQTTVWGYNGSYPGGTFEARRGTPITVRWTNDLTKGGSVLPHLFDVDETLHWANPKGWPKSGVPLVTHLHGGHTDAASDGHHEAWFTPGFGQVGPHWVQETYTYDNDQEATTLWYHDHTLGLTRQNVYAGLAGFYHLRDDHEDKLNLPRGEFEIPLVIQDRVFSDDGQLVYNDPHFLGGVFGDFILVNGKAWPGLEVEPRKYRFRLLNASDSRFYDLSLLTEQAKEVSFFQIGTDAGLLLESTPRTQLLLAPGERADIVIDFSQLEGQSIEVRNTARAPHPSGTVPNPATVGQIMQFRVTRPLSGKDTSQVPPILRDSYPDPGPSIRTRQLIFSTIGSGANRTHLLGTAADGRLRAYDPATETPGLNDVETWEFYNNTGVSHPVHLHLVSMRALSLHRFTGRIDPVTGALTEIQLTDPPEDPSLDQVGLKDTLVVPPGRMLRISTSPFDREGEYVWHCHMLQHEDMEMLRPLVVGGRGGRPGSHGGFPLRASSTTSDQQVSRFLEMATHHMSAGDSGPASGHSAVLQSGSGSAYLVAPIGEYAHLTMPVHDLPRDARWAHLGEVPEKPKWHKPG